MSLLRLYLEPPNMKGLSVNTNIPAALNVLKEHHQKISTAQVILYPLHSIRFSTFLRVFVCLLTRDVQSGCGLSFSISLSVCQWHPHHR